MQAVKKAVIPAAGLGTRVLPATKALPKGVLPIGAKPAIQYLVDGAGRSGSPPHLLPPGRARRARSYLRKGVRPGAGDGRPGGKPPAAL